MPRGRGARKYRSGRDTRIDIGGRHYDWLMPIYEFRCEACGARFERLVAMGTLTLPCPDCGSERTDRVLSAQASPFNMVKSPDAARRQERRNAELRQRAEADFKSRRKRARDRAARGDA
jgi:putative FmdB family regulatory protein